MTTTYMQFDEAKEKFIQAWGTLGTKWGINRTMAQVHALLLVSPDALSATEIMEQLNISRGNANMNLRALIDWGLIMKELKPGDRKEYFFAEKDIWKMSKLILIQRKKKELEPIMRVLEELKGEMTQNNSQEAAMHQTITDLHDFSQHADQVVEKVIQSDLNWLQEKFLKQFLK